MNFNIDELFDASKKRLGEASPSKKRKKKKMAAS